MWQVKHFVRTHVTIIRLKMMLAIVLAFYLSQQFGDAPSFQTNVYFARLRVDQMKAHVQTWSSTWNTKPTYDAPLSPTPAAGTFTFGFGNDPLPTIPRPTQVPTSPPDSSNPFIPPLAQPTSIPQTSTPVPVLPTATPTQIVMASIQCPGTSGENYSSLTIEGPATANAAGQGDINLALRGYSQVQESKDFQGFSANFDIKRPQLKNIFSPGRGADFVNTYRVNEWNFDAGSRGGPITNPSVSMISLRTNSGETVVVPGSNYSIGSGKQVLVLYADSTRVTLKYTREDNVVYGYTLHVEDFCTDPNLVSYYNQMNASGRGSLPALEAGKKIGVAKSGELKIVIRDTGSFMDPRRQDWW